MQRDAWSNFESETQLDRTRRRNVVKTCTTDRTSASARPLLNRRQARSGHPTEETRLRAESYRHTNGLEPAPPGSGWRGRCLEY
jgi:hypothetical protein